MPWINETCSSKTGRSSVWMGDVRADWLLTQGGKIARLGVGKCDPEYISGTVQIIDAGGRTVLPGFIDNHFQVVRTGLECGYVDLSHVRNYDEIGQIIRREAAQPQRCHCLPAGQQPPGGKGPSGPQGPGPLLRR